MLMAGTLSLDPHDSSEHTQQPERKQHDPKGKKPKQKKARWTGKGRDPKRGKAQEREKEPEAQVSFASYLSSLPALWVLLVR